MKKLALVLPMLAFLASQCIADTTAGKPSGVQLTIYNQNFALVKEQRDVTLSQGINFVSVPDVAATIEPESVAFKSLTDPASVVVREQNYRYDVIEPMTILNKSIGKRVKVTFLQTNQVVEGILLNPASMTQMPQDQYSSPSIRYNGLVVQTDKGIVMLPAVSSYGPQSMVVETLELPEGLVSRPTLVWKLESNKPGAHKTEVSYLADQITWEADYVAVVDQFDKFVDLTGWVTLDNKSGATYTDASLNLMAGDVHRVETARPRMMMAAGGFGGAMKADMGPQFAEKSFFEYHLYTLDGTTDVRDKETKQLTLMTAARIPAVKKYIFDGRKQWWQQYMMNPDFHPGESYDTSPNKKVAVYMEVMNTKENHLGIPLPKGTVKVYKQELNANQHFIGEDEIDHTPKDEKVRLLLGNAFDIVAEHARTNFKRISAYEVEETFQITLRNHKDTQVTVNVVEHLFNDWTITQSTHKYFKKDASTVEIPVDVPKDGEVKVEYTARTKWM